MHEAPLVSILVNNYNYGRFLSEAIDSALAQTYANIEVVVVDDGSTDNSAEVLATYGDRIRLVAKENGGQSSAFNAGFQVSRGPLICFLDSDDIFEPHKVARIVEIFAGDSEIGWCFDRARHFEDTTKEWFPWTANVHKGKIDARGIVANGHAPYVFTSTSGLSFRRETLGHILPMPETLRIKSGISSDNYLKFAAYSLSSGWLVSEPLTLQRIHRSNAYTRRVSDKARIVGLSDILLGMCLSREFRILQHLGTKIFAHGLGKLWATGGLELEHREIAGTFLKSLSPQLRIEAILRAMWWGASEKFRRQSWDH
ncbi:glycosyltransferase family 2 protein [Acidicapsa dinghuensis]|uniref:Glycosyltransferase family 2 protein n=1 Tax=Acidicapsa dinghuensis TaxID=2218256 RepID=A0ABW1EK69_9BACT|nr:glycosyltransferase family 2 protein [Acidicapsa dinghuensis]